MLNIAIFFRKSNMQFEYILHSTTKIFIIAAVAYWSIIINGVAHLSVNRRSNLGNNYRIGSEASFGYPIECGYISVIY